MTVVRLAFIILDVDILISSSSPFHGITKKENMENSCDKTTFSPGIKVEQVIKYSSLFLEM